MTDTVLHTLSVPFAIIAGTGAGLLAVLSWKIFRESPFGIVVVLLSFLMSAITIYHVILPVFGPESMFLQVFRSATHTIIAIFILLMIRAHRQLRGNTPSE